MPPSITSVEHPALVAEAPPSCKSNISPRGRRRRVRFGFEMTALALLLTVAFVTLQTAWFWRLAVGLPAMLAAVGFLQARRNTCIARAAEGTFEHDDYSKSPAPAEEVAASRTVAAGIRRDAALIGAASAVLAAATTLIR